LKEDENLIFLRFESECYIIDSGNNKNALLFMSKICESCGFNEIVNKSPSTSLPSTSTSLSTSLNNFSNCLIPTILNSKLISNGTSNKIAGIASSAVGSIDLCSDPNLFKQYSFNNNDNNNNIVSNPDYLPLEECQSGLSIQNPDNDNKIRSSIIFAATSKLPPPPPPTLTTTTTTTTKPIKHHNSNDYVNTLLSNDTKHLKYINLTQVLFNLILFFFFK
jgi:hypothetical protein